MTLSFFLIKVRTILIKNTMNAEAKSNYWTTLFKSHIEQTAKNTNDTENSTPIDENAAAAPENDIPVLHIMIDKNPEITAGVIFKDVSVALLPMMFLVGSMVFGSFYLYFKKDRDKLSEQVRFKKHLEDFNKKTIPEIITMFEKAGMYGQKKGLETGAAWLKSYANMIIDTLTPGSDQTIKKQNLIILGPSGSGKTEWFKIMQRILFKDFPHMCAFIDATKDSIQWSMSDLASESNGTNGILGVDEIGKGINSGMVRPRELLSLIEEGTLDIGTKPSMAEEIMVAIRGKKPKLSTKNMPIVLIESFSEKNKDGKTLEDIVIERNSNVVKDGKAWVDAVNNLDVGIYFGSDDFGKRADIMKMNELTEDDFFKILTHPTKSILFYKKTIENEFNINIIITDEIYRHIVTKNAFFSRGGRSIDGTMRDIYYSIRDINEIRDRPNKHATKIDYTITKDFIDKLAEKKAEEQKKAPKNPGPKPQPESNGGTEDAIKKVLLSLLRGKA